MKVISILTCYLSCTEKAGWGGNTNMLPDDLLTCAWYLLLSMHNCS